jgi:hypothetical protein
MLVEKGRRGEGEKTRRREDEKTRRREDEKAVAFRVESNKQCQPRIKVVHFFT